MLDCSRCERALYDDRIDAAGDAPSSEFRSASDTAWLKTRSRLCSSERCSAVRAPQAQIRQRSAQSLISSAAVETMASLARSPTAR